MYKIILFDLDGTLTDSSEGICKSLQYALERIGRPVPELKELECFIGPPLKTSFKLYQNLEGPEAERAIAFYRERYAKVGKFENKPYDGIIELLGKLKDAGYILAVATGKPELYAGDIIEHFGMGEYFTEVVGGDLEGKRDRKEDVIREVLKRLSVTAEEACECAVMIGDRHFDVEGAKAVGIDCIGVTFGFGNATELKEAGADYIADSVTELWQLIVDKSRGMQ